MLKSIAFVAFLSLAADQTVEPSLRRFGSVGRALTESEITQIGQLAKAAGKSPWLLHGDPTMMTRLFRIALYLQPDISRDGLWRGRMLSLEADSPDGATRSSWRIASTYAYGYVVPLEGARAISSASDVNWPFLVVGEFDDETLLSLVDFIRSSPPIPGVPPNSSPRNVDGTRPISSVGREDDKVVVRLSTGPNQGLEITLVRANGSWEVTKFLMWIV
jgi:hypothetical protein